MSWDPYGDIGQQAREATERSQQGEDEVNKLCHRVFSTEDGKKLLAYFIGHTLDKPVCMHQYGAIQGAAYGFHREGQNSIIREIQTRIKKALEG